MNTVKAAFALLRGCRERDQSLLDRLSPEAVARVAAASHARPVAVAGAAYPSVVARYPSVAVTVGSMVQPTPAQPVAMGPICAPEEKTFSIFSHAQTRAIHQSLRTAPPLRDEPLTERYRPVTLDELVGQGAVRLALETYAEAPYPCAFLFSGPTGVGKTSAALALAHDMNIDPMWALHKVSSGMMDAEAVEEVLKGMRYVAPGGSFKMVIVDEADLMSVKAAHLWLSILEELPRRVVVIFTTNNPEKLGQRFRDRCETLAFAANPQTLAQDAETLALRVWRGERYPGDPPPLAQAKGIVVDGAMSFRRVVQWIASLRQVSVA